MSGLLDKIPVSWINNGTVGSFAAGVLATGSALGIAAKIDPSGTAQALQASMCSDALVAVINDHSDKIMGCIADKNLCHGKLEILQAE
ncbi:hypothetical protein [uncultured Paraglaciecola sp.]|uniref:hypothetical protein n=1 Tax=uncultured Paraglaciecola sp. TaxID=1765024 RepID=UPI00263558C5|nr:hypothetical protein [uncultured Paraglaciecola sp.]